jgi:hypothetical protein
MGEALSIKIQWETGPVHILASAVGLIMKILCFSVVGYLAGNGVCFAVVGGFKPETNERRESQRMIYR